MGSTIELTAASHKLSAYVNSPGNAMERMVLHLG
jgi:hypothetical protein